MYSPLPSALHGSMYKAHRNGAPSPPLHYEVEYALDLVDALRARVEAGSASSVEPLELLEFTTMFTQPPDDATAQILYGGAQRVTFDSH